MSFLLICIVSLVVLGVVAALATLFSKGGNDEPVIPAHDCSTCSSMADGECKIACLLKEQKQRKASRENSAAEEAY